MYVKRINIVVKGAAFVELCDFISFGCFLFPWERGEEVMGSRLYWKREREQKFLGRVFN